jgi:hypothetical protein
LNVSQAMQELTMERLAALALRGLSFYDSRRWGWTYAIADGGGRYGCTLIYNSIVYANATIDYNFMDYWDVPADETDKNPPSSDSAPVKNPKYYVQLKSPGKSGLVLIKKPEFGEMIICV